MSYDAALLEAAGREARYLLAEIDGSRGVWIFGADGEELAHAGSDGSNPRHVVSICASMTALSGVLAACSGTGTPRSLVLETSNSRWVMQTLTLSARKWIVVLLTDRLCLLAWALSRISITNQRLSGG